MSPQELRKVSLAQLSCNQVYHGRIKIILEGNNMDIVQGQKSQSCVQRGPFVAIAKGVVFAQVKGVCGSDVKKVRLSAVQISVLRLSEGRLQETGITQTRITPEKEHLLAVKGQDFLPG